jgi:hypothetical protein
MQNDFYQNRFNMWECASRIHSKVMDDEVESSSSVVILVRWIRVEKADRIALFC